MGEISPMSPHRAGNELKNDKLKKMLNRKLMQITVSPRHSYAPLRSILRKWSITCEIMENFSAAIKCKQQGQEVTYFALGPWKPCPCEKNRLSGSGTHQHICADVARIDIRVFFLKQKVNKLILWDSVHGNNNNNNNNYSFWSASLRLGALTILNRNNEKLITIYKFLYSWSKLQLLIH